MAAPAKYARATTHTSKRIVVIGTTREVSVAEKHVIVFQNDKVGTERLKIN